MEASKVPVLHLPSRDCDLSPHGEESSEVSVFRRSRKIHVLILWHLQQSSISSVSTRCFAESINQQSRFRSMTPSPKALSQRYWGCFTGDGDGDRDNHWYCWKLFLFQGHVPFPWQRLVTESARRCQIFPVRFFLAELKSIKGWILSFHVDPAIVLIHLKARNMPSILKMCGGWRAWTEGLTRSPAH